MTIVSEALNKVPKTGIVLLNLGGPRNKEEVYPFLHRLFSDPDLIPIPFQKHLAPLIAKRRTPSIQQHYAEIGGGSPIRYWTSKQADMMIERLDKISPDTGPHKAYIAFRYASPLTEDAISQMVDDGVERAVAFTQYPQYSCSTTGSSLNELAKQLSSFPGASNIKWSVIDRWPTHSGLVKSFAELINKKLSERYAKEERNNVVLLFSAHSLPMSVVNRGDTYPGEVATTVHAVMKQLNFSNPYRLVWQSQVGPSPWLGPRTDVALEGLGKSGYKNVLMIPIAFTSDHIETLHELDLEYSDLAKKAGVSGISRCDSLNDFPMFIDALADIVKNHLVSGKKVSSNQYKLRCPSCDKESCKKAREIFSS